MKMQRDLGRWRGRDGDQVDCFSPQNNQKIKNLLGFQRATLEKIGDDSFDDLIKWNGILDFAN